MFSGVSGPSFIFWPVGNGDSTTVVISDSEVVQVDLNDKKAAHAVGSGHAPIIDELVAKLPKQGSQPYLSCFVLTHPDLDHCRGFAELLDRVTIGEIWHTPRIFREYEDDCELSDDAMAFRREAHRRAQRCIDSGGDPGSGHRVRIIGYSELFEPGERYANFPREQFYTRPGQPITVLDGIDTRDRFHAFVHAPFKEGHAGERNETSLAMQVSIGPPSNSLKGLFLGDLSYPTLMQVFDETHRHDNDGMLQWNILLSPHHCSKKAMYEDDRHQQDVMDEFSKCQLVPGYVVASSNEFPHANEPGDNPPHVVARNRYEEIVNDAFLCTGEVSTEDQVQPIIFSLTANGITLDTGNFALSEQAATTLAEAVAKARGSSAPPATKVGFGAK